MYMYANSKVSVYSSAQSQLNVTRPSPFGWDQRARQNHNQRYRIWGNFREHKFLRITNMPGKKFCDFYFCDKITLSDYTPYNFPHVFQHQNDIKTLPCLSKHVGCCRKKTAMPNSEDLFTVAVMTGKLIVGREKLLQLLDASTTKQVIFVLIYWICGLCSTRQQEIFGGKKFHGDKFRKLVSDWENRETFCLAKISYYTI